MAQSPLLCSSSLLLHSSQKGESIPFLSSSWTTVGKFIILRFMPKTFSCELPVNHHILIMTINHVAHPYTLIQSEIEPLLPTHLDCQSCNPTSVRFFALALTNVIQLFLISTQKVIKKIVLPAHHLSHIHYPFVSLDFLSISVESNRRHQTSTSWAFHHLPVLTSHQLQSLTWHKTNLHSES